MNNLKLFLSRPAVFHGVLTGGIVFLAKFTFYLTHHWELCFSNSFPLASFLLIVGGVLMGGFAERKIYLEKFTYSKALLSGLITIFFIVLLSGIADQVLYRVIDTDLKAQTVSINLQKTTESFKLLGDKFLSNEDKDKVLEEIRKADPASFASFFMGIPVKVFMNGIFMLLIAVFTRVKPDKNQWLKEN
jgi:hypothetical protein